MEIYGDKRNSMDFERLDGVGNMRGLASSRGQ